MTFEIEINGRVRSVSVERTPGAGRYRVTVDGATHAVDATRVGEFGLSLLLDEAGTSREIAVVPGSARGELLIDFEGRTIAASVNARRTGRAAGDAGAHAHGEQAVAAPMPGRVMRVLVAPGDEVAARQPLVVVEAMKMENELRAPRAGRVKEVGVAPGASVEAGRVLVVIE